MIYLASITAWLAAWGPVAWGAVGIASTVALTFGYFLYKVGKIMPVLVRPVIDFVVDLRIDSSALSEISRDRETSCRKEVRREAQR